MVGTPRARTLLASIVTPARRVALSNIVCVCFPAESIGSDPEPHCIESGGQHDVVSSHFQGQVAQNVNYQTMFVAINKVCKVADTKCYGCCKLLRERMKSARWIT
jgi:hypothetical protein